MARRSTLFSLLAGIGIGGAAGVAAGIAFAPASGERTRKKIAGAAGDVVQKGRASLDTATERATDLLVNKGKARLAGERAQSGPHKRPAAHPGRHTSRESASGTPRARVPRAPKTA